MYVAAFLSTPPPLVPQQIVELSEDFVGAESGSFIPRLFSDHSA